MDTLPIHQFLRLRTLDGSDSAMDPMAPTLIAMSGIREIRPNDRNSPVSGPTLIYFHNREHPVTVQESFLTVTEMLLRAQGNVVQPPADAPRPVSQHD